MTRDDHLQAILDIAYKPLLLQIGTGVGKTRIAIELLKKWDAKRIFILVPMRSIMLSWEAELKKWNFDTKGKTIEIQCNASIHKFAALSATVPKDAKLRIKELVPNIIEYKISARKAITDNILPDPKVVLIKLFLNTKDKTECIVLNKGKGKPIELDWEHRSGYMKAKYPEIRIHCTEWQYYNYISAKVEKLKTGFRSTGEEFRKNMWLHKNTWPCHHR